MEEMQETPQTDPMAFTKERLSEIGEVWFEFAKQQAEAYKDKLPDAIKQYLQPKAPEPTAESSPEVAQDGAA